MPVPKKKRSKSKKRIKRACWKLEEVSLSLCPVCRFATRSHVACKNCGSYDGVQVIKRRQRKG